MLQCTRCDRTYPLGEAFQRCECGAPLEVPVQRGAILEGTVWERYREFYPFNITLDTLGAGETPLIKAQKLSEKLNVDLFLKNETVNPTWSFKDRGTLTGVQRAINLESQRIGTVSTGNMAASVAAYGARVNIETTILVSAGISKEKLLPIAVYGPHLIKVVGDYGELYYKSLEIGRENDIHFINSDVPFRIEGYKTISFEINEKVTPDYVIIPTSSGGLFRGVLKGFLELKKSDIIEELPSLIVAQAEGCSPIYRAFKTEKKGIERVSDPHTVAHAIANPYPPSGNAVLRKLRTYRGSAIAVSDEEILRTQKELAKEGIFVQPASTVGVAGLKKLRKEGKIPDRATVVIILTGSGLKYLSSLKSLPEPEKCSLDELENSF